MRNVLKIQKEIKFNRSLKMIVIFFLSYVIDQNVVQETKKLRVNIDDFQIKDLIGKGYYGEVHLAIENVTHDVYAIKKIPKISYAQSKERNIMAISKSDWIPALQYAFQVS